MRVTKNGLACQHCSLLSYDICSFVDIIDILDATLTVVFLLDNAVN